MTVFVDIGYLIALAQPSDALHARAKAWATVLAEPVIISEYVLWETVNGLSRIDRPKAHQIVEYVNSTANWIVVPASNQWWLAGLELHRDQADDGNGPKHLILRITSIAHHPSCTA